MTIRFILLFFAGIASIAVACNSSDPKTTAKPSAGQATTINTDSCAIAVKYEGARIAEAMVGGNYSGEMNNYMGTDKSKIDFKHVYKDGKIVKSYFYYVNQHLQEEYSFLCGSLHGLQKWYYENGKLAKVIPYSYGYRNGIAQVFDSTGNLLQTATFKNDSLVEKN
jgi:hypothetical protein